MWELQGGELTGPSPSVWGSAWQWQAKDGFITWELTCAHHGGVWSGSDSPGSSPLSSHAWLHFWMPSNIEQETRYRQRREREHSINSVGYIESRMHRLFRLSVLHASSTMVGWKIYSLRCLSRLSLTKFRVRYIDLSASVCKSLGTLHQMRPFHYSQLKLKGNLTVFEHHKLKMPFNLLLIFKANFPIHPCLHAFVEKSLWKMPL